MCPRVLLIDSYDSFTYNLAALCKTAISDCSVHIIKNDAITYEQLLAILPHFTAIIVGPGPGSPERPADIGIIDKLWKLPGSYLVPVFGVCLGLQSLGLAFGARLKNLSIVKHGQISTLHHNGTGLFEGVTCARVVRYHSLHIELENGGEIEELASVEDAGENGHVVMAARHVTKPFWAVQYHPESACTEGGSARVLQNFCRLANAWSGRHGRFQASWSLYAEKTAGPPWPFFEVPRQLRLPYTPYKVSFATLHFPSFSVTQACEMLGVCNESYPFVLLQSASQPGRFSIIGCVDTDSPRISFFSGEPYTGLSHGKCKSPPPSDDIWSWLSSFMLMHQAEGGSLDVPFWGGLVGYLSYELGVSRLAPQLPFGRSSCRHPDVNLVFVERSVVFDHLTGTVYIQTLRPYDQEWIVRSKSTIANSSSVHDNLDTHCPIFHPTPVVHLPDETQYKARIQAAKEHLYAGDSYELCLTANTRVSIHPILRDSSSSWELYKSIQNKNPAPHSGYLRLHPTTLLSSSPERFLSFSRPPRSRCQLRPIKGTIQKGPGITREVAEQRLAGSSKEIAENLMIVDLIRHDLHGVVGDEVSVKHFCRVEEYETVWQLTSVIEGNLPLDAPQSAEEQLGWRVLQHSLPPGSMTGAPKKRSVEILHSLENDSRGLYSGVFGYWDVGGGGDWSVVIRSCVKHNDDRKHRTEATEATSGAISEEWTIGAGGAITALSDPQAEWEEMCIKLKSVLQAFSVDL